MNENHKLETSDILPLYRRGIISQVDYLPAINFTRDDNYWHLWASRLILGLGVGHILAGVIFFFAFNWAKIPAFGKFGIVEAGILICTLCAYMIGLQKPMGKILLLSSSVLVGVLMAVFGQIYQTGANAFELFVNWSILILPWVLLSFSAAHWLVWLIILNLGYILFLDQVSNSYLMTNMNLFFIIPSLANLALLMFNEIFLKDKLCRLSLVTLTLSYLFVPSFWFAFSPTPNSLIAVTIFFSLTLAGLYFYYFKKPSYPTIVLITSISVIYILLKGIKQISNNIDDQFLGVFLISIWSILLTICTSLLLNRIRPQNKKVSK